MNKYIYLQKFKENELIFDETETIIILKFTFKNHHDLVDRLEINNRIREFAQGLLAEAVDASYALGFVHSLFGGVFNPGAGFKKILTKFGRKALKHWFKHAAAKDLMSIKIYEIVRRELERSFTTPLKLFVSGVASAEIRNSGFVNYSDTNKAKTMLWG